MNIDEIIARRYSPRAYTNKIVDETTMHVLLDAARWAASSGNSQPWRFIYARNNESETWDKLLDCLTDSNKAWAKSAPVLMLTVVQTVNSIKGRKNSHAEYGLGLAMGNFTLKAMDLGLHLRNMGGYSAEKARENFQIPENFEPAVMVAIGYPADQQGLIDPFVVATGEKRQRRSLDEIIFRGDWSIMQ